MKRSWIFAAMLVLAPFSALAQDYPSKPVRVIVPNAVGGATDAAARLYQRALEDILPQPLVVVNMPGAGTATGSREVKDARPDGYTMLLLHQALFTASAMGLTDYGPEAFEPVAMTGLEPTVIIVRGDSPFQTLDDLYEAAKESPGSVKAGVQIGALNHFGMAMAAEAGGVEFNYVQTGGGGPTYAALLGDHIDVAYGSLPDVMQYVEAGEMRILAVLSEKRSDALPEAQTAVEQGFDLVLPIRHVWFMPKDTPAEPVAVMEEALTEALDSEVVKEFYAARSIEPVIVTGQELRDQLSKEYQQFLKIEAAMEQ